MVLTNLGILIPSSGRSTYTYLDEEIYLTDIKEMYITEERNYNNGYRLIIIL